MALRWEWIKQYWSNIYGQLVIRGQQKSRMSGDHNYLIMTLKMLSLKINKGIKPSHKPWVNPKKFI